MSIESESPEAGTANDLSPAVRRLIRQYGIDSTTIRGSGPEGRIRVSDVMATLGNRPVTETAIGDEDTPERSATAATLADSEPGSTGPQAAPQDTLPKQSRNPGTLVAECEVDALLTHVQAHYPTAPDAGLMLCVLSACAQAIREVPEIGHPSEYLVAEITWPDSAGHENRWIADTSQSGLPQALMQAWLAGKAAVSEAAAAHTTATDPPSDRHHAGTTLALHWLGSSVASRATRLPLRDHHATGVAIGSPQARVVVQGAPGQEAARIRQVMTVMLGFDAQKVSLHRADHFLACIVQRLQSAFSTAAMQSAT